MDKKGEIIQTLTAVISALDNVSTRGKTNLNNLGGSIEVLERLREEVKKLSITMPE